MLTSTFLKTEKLISNDNSIMIYLLVYNEDKVKKICGLSINDWVKKSILNFPMIEFDYNNEDLLIFLKERLVDSKYSLILYSNTPLITTPSIMKIMEYIAIKDINACKFNGGFAFKNEYIKNTKKVVFDAYLPLDEAEFIVVNNLKSLNFATKQLQSRIIQKHINNGVEISSDCIIDEMVEVGKDSIIFSGNTIKGNTVIGDNCIIKENNVIEDCCIGDGVCISSSNLTNSKVENNSFILPYCYVNNSIIRENCYISSGMEINNRTIRKGSKIRKEN